MSDDVTLVGPQGNEGPTASDLTNEDLKERFFEHNDSATKSNSASFYESNFTPFLEYVEAGGGHLTKHVGSQDIERFLREEAETLAPKTVSHRYSAISRFYTVLRDRLGLLPREETLPIERVEKKSIRGLSEKTVMETTEGEKFYYLEPDEVGQVIDAIPYSAMRNRSLVSLLANTGMRASEVIRVRVDGDHLDLENRELTVVSPKLSEDDENDPEWITVYWRSKALSDLLDSYIELERPSYPFAEESPYLFPSKQSERIGYNMVNRMVKEAAEKAGLQESMGTDGKGNERKKVTPHTLRHSWAMSALSNGMHIDEIRDNLHHSDISVTMKYLRRHEEDRRKAIEKNGPQFG